MITMLDAALHKKSIALKKQALSDADKHAIDLVHAFMQKRLLLQSSFYEFVVYAFKKVEPMTEFQSNWHIKELCDVAQKEIQRFPAMGSMNAKFEAKFKKKTKDYVVNVPPRSLKSFIYSICLPAWAWIERPYLKFICSSWNNKLSSEHSLKCRQIILSGWYQMFWGDRGDRQKRRVVVSLSRDQAEKTNFQNTLGGARYAFSVGSAPMGFGAHVIIVDDPQNPRKAFNALASEQAWDHYSKDLASRYDAPESGVKFLVQQRLSAIDCTGKLRGEDLPTDTPEQQKYKQEFVDKFEKNYTHLCFPASIQDPENKQAVSPAKHIKRYKQALLFPKRLGKMVLSKLQDELGPYAYAGQYDQRPTLLKGGLIKRTWFCYYKELPRIQATYISMDLPNDGKREDKKGKDNPDYAGIGVWGVSGKNNYRLDGRMEQWALPKVISELKLLIKRYKPRGILIENAGYGPTLIRMLQNEGIQGIIRIEKPSISKTERGHLCVPQFCAGDVWLPEQALWVGSYVSQITMFPAVANDDLWDETMQFLIYRARNQSNWVA